jgi:hypothetical protein
MFCTWRVLAARRLSQPLNLTSPHGVEFKKGINQRVLAGCKLADIFVK